MLLVPSTIAAQVPVSTAKNKSVFELVKVEGEQMDLRSGDDRLDSCIVPPDITLLEALSVLDENYSGVLLVANDDYQLQGVVTDGDIRRGILARHTLDESISAIINNEAVIGLKNERTGRLRRRMWKNNLRHLPILDESGRIVGLEISADLRQSSETPVVVIMAGGLGTQLRPLTHDCPKPLLEVGGSPFWSTSLKSWPIKGLRGL